LFQFLGIVGIDAFPSMVAQKGCVFAGFPVSRRFTNLKQIGILKECLPHIVIRYSVVIAIV
jgi:hypothetical protein